MVLMLVAAGAFVHARLRADLDERVDEALAARTPGADEEGFGQLLARDGRVLAGPRVRVLGPAERRRAAVGRVTVERRVAGVEGRARVLGRPAGGRVRVAGQSLDDRDEALASVVQSFALGGAVAVVLASLVGYALATAALRPVEAMRRRAESVALDRGDAALPLPAAHDEIRRLGETLNAMLARLAAAYDRERRFVADASHELRTPIAVVKAELEAALRSGGHGAGAHAALVAALDACEDLGRLADDLLVLARAGEGGLPVRPERLAAREALERVVERFADRAALHGRGIRVVVTGEPVLEADPLRVAQAVGNLVDNALRHGAGDIELRAAAPRAGVVELTVADEGPGFSGDLAPRAFERFARDDRARGGGAGAGLGLAIVRAIAAAHGGTATIAPGPGAAVRLSLPAAEPPQGDLSGAPYGRSERHPRQEDTR